MAISYPGTPAAGLFTTESVDWTYKHTEVKRMIEEYNASMDFAFISKYIQDTPMKKLRHFQRSFEWIGVSGDTVPQETQKMGGWDAILPLHTFSTRYELTEAAMANDMQGIVDMATADIVRGYERLQVKLALRQMLNDNSAFAVGTDIQTQGGFWNGAVTLTGSIPDWKGAVHASTHTHYESTASATEYTLTDLNTQIEQIRHHGYAPSNANLRLFTNASGITMLANQFQASSMMVPTPVSTDIAVNGFGDMATGITLNGAAIMCDDWMPSLYYLMLSDLVPVVARRIPQNPAYQGLQFQLDNVSGNPILGSKYWTQLGHFVAEKGAGHVYKMAGSWADPASTTGIMKFGWQS